MADLHGHTLPAWAVLVPRGTTSVDARGARSAGRLPALDGVAPLSWVSIVDDHRFSHWRLRRLAKRSGFVVERELVVVPGADATVVVGDAVSLRGLGLLRWSWIRWWASERVVLARRR